MTEPPPLPKILPALKEIEVNRVCHGDDNFKFFFGGFQTTEILPNLSLADKFFVLYQRVGMK